MSPIGKNACPLSQVTVAYIRLVKANCLWFYKVCSKICRCCNDAISSTTPSRIANHQSSFGFSDERHLLAITRLTKDQRILFKVHMKLFSPVSFKESPKSESHAIILCKADRSCH